MKVVSGNNFISQNRPVESSHLLVVDDEVDVAGFISEIAQEMGFEVTAVHEGNLVLEVYLTCLPDTIILDLSLPGYDGVELLRMLSQNQCRANILLASGSDSRTIATARTVGLQLGLNIVGTLSKPLLIENLEMALAPLMIENKRHGPVDRRGREGPVSADGNSVAAPEKFIVNPVQVASAISENQLRVFFQPKMELISSNGQKMMGMEALVRWQHPEQGIIYPDDFIPVAQRAALMFELTDEVLQQSFHAMRDWKTLGQEIVVSINLDGALFDNLKLPDYLGEMAESFGLQPSNITLEVTESAAMNDPVKTMDILTRFRVKGFNVSMDDFGTGFSSLVELYRLPFNELKIDKSFVMDIGKNKEADGIVETLAMLGKKLGIKVCAEGVETAEILEFVRQCGCDLGQGYLFSKAIEPSQIPVFAGFEN